MERYWFIYDGTNWVNISQCLLVLGGIRSVEGDAG